MQRPPFLLPAYPVLAHLSVSYSRCRGRLLTRYSPVRHSTRSPKKPFAFDLHVLSTPPAFVLSQDQTLQFDILNRFPGSYSIRALFELQRCPCILRYFGPVCCCCYSVVKDRLGSRHDAENPRGNPAEKSKINRLKPFRQSLFYSFCPSIRRSAVRLTSCNGQRVPSSTGPRQTT